MNLYLRYFDKETLVTNVDDALDFLRSIQEIGMNANLEADVREYANNDVYYPKRYKIRPRVYFIIIKTTAATMLDFKQKKALHPVPQNGAAAYGFGCNFTPERRTSGMVRRRIGLQARCIDSCYWQARISRHTLCRKMQSQFGTRLLQSHC